MLADVTVFLVFLVSLLLFAIDWVRAVDYLCSVRDGYELLLLTLR
jgi:hypothetical protein